MSSDDFNCVAPDRKVVPDSPEREDLAPKELITAGITTPAVLDFLDRQLPETPRPQPSPGDPVGWKNALENAHAERVQFRAQHRNAFDATFEKMRSDFTLASTKNSKGRSL